MAKGPPLQRGPCEPRDEEGALGASHLLALPGRELPEFPRKRAGAHAVQWGASAGAAAAELSSSSARDLGGLSVGRWGTSDTTSPTLVLPPVRRGFPLP